MPLLVFTVMISLAFTVKSDSQVSFSIDAYVNSNVNTGTFTSSGLAGSSGNFIENYTFNGKKTHSEATFIYGNGTITAKTHCVVTITSPSTATGIGTWIIVKGTGAYAKIKGSGSLTFDVIDIATPAEHITEIWEGSVK